MNRKLNKISGVTLIELLVGVAVTALMMGAMFASYTAVNSSYKQVTDKARISSSSRDIVGMMMKDIRLAGFKYYYGKNDEDIPFADNLTHVTGLEDGRGIIDSHDPIIVFRNTLGYSAADVTSITPPSTSAPCGRRRHLSSSPRLNLFPTTRPLTEAPGQRSRRPLCRTRRSSQTRRPPTRSRARSSDLAYIVDVMSYLKPPRVGATAR